MTYQIRKKAKLLNMENKWREEQQGNTSWFWTSFANSFTSTVADNLQVKVDIYVYYMYVLRLLLMIFIYDTKIMN